MTVFTTLFRYSIIDTNFAAWGGVILPILRFRVQKTSDNNRCEAKKLLTKAKRL